MICRSIITALLGVCLLAGAAVAQVDVTKLKEKIAARQGEYSEIMNLLEAADGTDALAVFDVLVETDNPSLLEMALNHGFTAADVTLRARALWEAMFRRDNLTIEIETDGLSDDAAAALNDWNGKTQTWDLYNKIAETKCISLRNLGNQCAAGYQLTVSGIKLDIRYTGQLSASFVLGEDGVLTGTLRGGKANRQQYDYNARIVFK